MASRKIRTGIRSFQVTDNTRGGTTSFDVKGTATVELSGEVRETLESANNPAAGARVMQTRGRIEIEVIDAGSLSLAAIQRWADVTCVVVGANGKTYACDGWQVEKPSLDMLEGGLPIVIEGTVTEQVSS